MNYKDIQLALAGKPVPSMQEFAQLIVDIRNTKLPDWHTLGTAGSFFKNPIVNTLDFDSLLVRFPGLVSFPGPTHDQVKLSAGQLIELAGLKGYRSGNAGVYEKHALILVNYGWAKGQEIVDLAEYIQDKVVEMFGVTLEPEVIYV
jgi:UDP-N-acetylmuramate dehydrogenase